MEGLFFDCRYIRIDHHDGISRFSAGLFKELAELIEVTAIVSDLRQLDKLPAGVQFVMLSDPTSALEPLVAFKLNKLGAKVVFSPMQTIGSLGRKFKLILTVHDLIYYRHPTPPPSFSFFVRALWRLYHLTFWPQRLLLNRSDAIVAVSETTKNLIEKHKLTKRPVNVVYNAAEDAPSDASPRQAPKTKSLVYMGSFMDYKNVELLISGMNLLQDFELRLLSRVTPARRAELEKLIPAGANVTFLNGVSEEEYQAELDKSFALVTASKDEGFGIPLVEAMALGIPIVVSNIEIFKEIGAKAGIYFDPESPESFAAAVRNLEGKNWHEASKEAIVQAKNFSWSKSAKSLLKTIQSL